MNSVDIWIIYLYLSPRAMLFLLSELVQLQWQHTSEIAPVYNGVNDRLISSRNPPDDEKSWWKAYIFFYNTSTTMFPLVKF